MYEAAGSIAQVVAGKIEEREATADLARVGNRIVVELDGPPEVTGRGGRTGRDQQRSHRLTAHRDRGDPTTNRFPVLEPRVDRVDIELLLRELAPAALTD